MVVLDGGIVGMDEKKGHSNDAKSHCKRDNATAMRGATPSAPLNIDPPSTFGVSIVTRRARAACVPRCFHGRETCKVSLVQCKVT